MICYTCNKPGHIAKHCRKSKQESKGRQPSQTASPKTKQVQSARPASEQNQLEDIGSPTNLLYSDSDGEAANTYTVRVSDEGSVSQYVKVQVQGVPAYGLIDTGADITIIGGKLFKRVAMVVRLWKRNFKRADKIPKTYDQRTFKLDGRMDLDLTFDGKTMCTPVYIKMGAADQLLLSEGVCRQLGIVTFHSQVEKWRGQRRKAQNREVTTPRTPEPDPPELTLEEASSEAKVPAVRMNLVHTAHILPHQGKLVEVSVEPSVDNKLLLLLEQTQLSCGVTVDASLLEVTEDGRAHAVLSNPTRISMTVEGESELGDASAVDVVDPQSSSDPQTESVSSAKSTLPNSTTVFHVHSKPDGWRKKKLVETVGPCDTLSPQQHEQLADFLGNHHTAFASEDHE